MDLAQAKQRIAESKTAKAKTAKATAAAAVGVDNGACNGPSAGQEYYQNICMKAVNQSIGRAIRHKVLYTHIKPITYFN